MDEKARTRNVIKDKGGRSTCRKDISRRKKVSTRKIKVAREKEKRRK